MLKKHMPAVWAAVITLASCALLAIGAREGYAEGVKAERVVCEDVVGSFQEALRHCKSGR